MLINLKVRFDVWNMSQHKINKIIIGLVYIIPNYKHKFGNKRIQELANFFFISFYILTFEVNLTTQKGT